MKTISSRYFFLLFMLSSAAVSAQQKLSLAEAASLAVENNLELKATAVGNEVSRYDRKAARGLFLPTVALSGQVNHYFKRSPFFGFGSETSGDKIPYGRFGGEDQFSAAVTAVQPLYNPVAGPAVKQAGLGTRKAQLEEQVKKIEITSLVRQTYLQILVLQDRIQVEQESLRRNRQVLRDARSLFLQGKALRVDTLRAYTSIKNIEPQIVKLEYAVESAKLRLKTLTGLTSEFVLTDSLYLQEPVPSYNENEVYETSLRDNPEVQLQTLLVEERKQDVNTTVAARLPVVSAVGQYQVLSQANDFQFADSYYPTSSFVGIQLAVPLFEGLRQQSKSQSARLKADQAVYREQYYQEQLKSRVQEAVAQNKESMERLQTALTVIQTAEVSYEIIQYRYQKGIASRLELTDAEFELSTAKSNYLQAVYDYLSSEIEISKLVGKID